MNQLFKLYFCRKSATLGLLIIDNYDSFVFNLVQLIEQAGETDYLIRKNDQLLSLDSDEFDKVLISPGPGIASESGDLPVFVKTHLERISILGICLGYEAIAEVCGGKLTQLAKPMHGVRTKGKVIADNQLFKGLPDRFHIGHYHSWIIERESFPNNLEATLENENGLIMAFRHKQYNLRGLQFHPESVMTEYGFEMIKNWLEI